MFNIFKDIKSRKAAKKFDKECKAAFEELSFCMPKRVNTALWSIAHNGNDSRVEWLNKELIDYIEQHPELESVAFVNLHSNTLQFYFDETGVRSFKNVLVKFFGEEQVENMYLLLADENRLAKIYTKQIEWLSKLGLTELHKEESKWSELTLEESANSLNANDSEHLKSAYKEVKENMLKLIRYEINRRKIK